MMTPEITRRRPAVRAPFRVLAGLLCFMGVVLLLGMAYVAWTHGAQSLRVKDVVMAPGIVWLTRLAFYAALRGSSPRPEFWPFASSRVARCYWLIVICFSVFAV